MGRRADVEATHDGSARVGPSLALERIRVRHLGHGPSLPTTCVPWSTCANAATAAANGVFSARQQIQQRRQEHLDRLARDGQDLLSPPDVSLTSISPGEETDETTTVTATPSSATVTPNRALPGTDELSEVLIKEKIAGVTRRVKKTNQSHASHRASYPSALAPVNELKGAASSTAAASVKRLSVGSGSGSGSNSTVNTTNSSSNSSVERLSSHGDDCKQFRDLSARDVVRRLGISLFFGSC